ncbi:hypothetical protein HDZ31DRAFT_79116 [Schizophyllum fasciatum]
MSTLPPSPTLPQELLDAILHHLAHSPTTLAACALAHRTLTPTAHALLFHTLRITRAPHARALRRLLHASPHLARHPRRLLLAEPHARWIAAAAPDLATALAALPALDALALRCAPACWLYLSDLRYALRRAARGVRALEIAGVRLVPPDLLVGPRLVALRLVDVSFAPAPQPLITRAPPCAPTTLELAHIAPRALSALRLAVGNITHLRLDCAGPEAAALVPLCAQTLQVLELDVRDAREVDLGDVNEVNLCSASGDGQHVLRRWLRAAPGVQRLLSPEGITMRGKLLVSRGVLREGRALQRVECVGMVGEGVAGNVLTNNTTGEGINAAGNLDGDKSAREELIGALDGVQVVRVCVPDGSDTLHAE